MPRMGHTSASTTPTQHSFIHVILAMASGGNTGHEYHWIEMVVVLVVVLQRSGSGDVERDVGEDLLAFLAWSVALNRLWFLLVSHRSVVYLKTKTKTSEEKNSVLLDKYLFVLCHVF